MSAQLLEGRAVARDMLDRARDELAVIATRGSGLPELAVLGAALDPSARSYLRAIRRTCDSVGLPLRAVELAGAVTADGLREAIVELNHDRAVAGILVLQPLPRQIPPGLAADSIDPMKDVDGITLISAGRLLSGMETLLPSTPAGGMAILQHYGIPTAGKQAVVVGRSMVVGKPMALLLLAADATVTICHSRSGDLGRVTREADILVAAVGRAGMITPEMVKPGAAVIDFGVNVIEGKLVGDVDPAVGDVASALTPVPGGTGVVTNAVLVSNVLKAARWQRAAGDENAVLRGE